MKYKKLKGLEREVSQLVQGTIMCDSQDQDYANEILDGVYALGVNCFDAAWGYGNGGSERALGNWIEKRGIRDQVVILTKCAHPTHDRMMSKPCDILSQFEDSVVRLKTDFIDIYMLHRDDMSQPVGPVVETLNKLKEQGRIGVFGGSNWSAKRLQEANEYAYKYGLYPMSVSSPNFGLAEQINDPWGFDCVSLTGASMADERKWYIEHDFPIFAYSSLGRGWFSGAFTRETFKDYRDKLDEACLTAYEHERNFQRLDRSWELAEKYNVKVPQIALAYILHQTELNVFPLIGAARVEEMADADAAFDIKLSPEEIKYLNLED